ncbi:MAG: hypothetical protein M1149_04160 [Candidatus Thermoplasmatota archaeon]|jgi:5S rRNA maturation endonuclease (ribonuclease M5)|nr:hypothetical protein [Candidatus Thermoplasmatota archaeon]
MEHVRERNLLIPIIVEGDHDISALRKMEFLGRILKINDGSNIDEFCMKIAGSCREVILLTDFDRKGRQLRERIEVLLTMNGCAVDTYLWRALRNFNIKSIEDLPSLFEVIENGNPGRRKKQDFK